MSPEVSEKKSMEDRIKEFRSDPQKMDVTTKFVNEVVEKAKDEALKRMKEKHKGKQKEEERQKVSRKRGTIEPLSLRFKKRICGGKTENEVDGSPELEASSPGYLHPFASATRKPGYRFTDEVRRTPEDYIWGSSAFSFLSFNDLKSEEEFELSPIENLWFPCDLLDKPKLSFIC